MSTFGPPGDPTMPPPLPDPAARPPRPWTVTTAAALMFVQALLSLVGLGVALATRDTTEAVIREQLARQDTPVTDTTVDAAMLFALGATVVLGLIVATAFIVLALLNLRGNNAARITTWVVCGLFLCCGGYTAVSTLAGPTDAIPGGLLAYQIVAAVLGMVLYIAIAVLLLLPPSNAYFRSVPRRY